MGPKKDFFQVLKKKEMNVDGYCMDEKWFNIIKQRLKCNCESLSTDSKSTFKGRHKKWKLREEVFVKKGKNIKHAIYPYFQVFIFLCESVEIVINVKCIFS